ncbi:MAG: NFACT RNA binding domain-containing protein [Holophaga sp.]|nr:NFACT RNA binding domain-containing protein [Holophaga sp.]
MDAPILLALARARLRAGEGAIQGAWAGPRALALLWAPDRRAGLEPGLAWVFMLNPAPELWLLHERDEAYLLLKAEARQDLTRRWQVELKGTRLTEVEGDPRERWLGLVLRRRAITGRIEAARLAFQAIPGRAGLRLDGLDLNPIRMGLGQMFPPGAPQPDQDPPPYLRFLARFGDQADAALAGEIPDLLPGEGPLLARHRAWSMERAAKLVLVPRKAGSDRKVAAERKRLERLRDALGRDRARHTLALGLRARAQALAGELYRLRGACGQALLLDGTRIDLPDGHRAEDAVQRWFAAVKRAERGLGRVAELEGELQHQMQALAYREAQLAAGLPDPLARPSRSSKQAPRGRKSMEKPEKRKDLRADGKGKAFRSVMVEGFEVLIGKGDADNDQLTFKVAAPLDLWLHVANTPGSHVVVRNPEHISELPRPLIERAAELAAFFSKARAGGKVEVHYCHAADVSKPRGFPPGKVLLRQWKSLRVYPKE